MSLYLDNELVDVDKAPTFSYTIKDIADPSKLKGARSYKIKIPSTPTAQKLLGSKQVGEPLKTPEAVVGDGTVEEYRGRAIPTKWTDRYIETYILADNAEWFQQAKSLDLRSIDFGVRTVTGTAIRNSWDYSDDVVYPLIDYGRWQDRDNLVDVSTSEVRPAVKVLPVLQKAFTNLGYSFKVGDSLKQRINDMILPNHTPIEADESYLEGESANLSFPSGSSAWTPSNPIETSPPFYSWTSAIPAGSAITDPGANLGGTGGSFYVVPYDMRLRVKFDITLDFSAPASTFAALKFVLYNEAFDPTLGDGPLASSQSFVVQGGSTVATGEIDFGEFPVRAGDVVGVAGIDAIAGGGTYTATYANCSFEPTYIPYQENFKYKLSTVLPDWSLMKLLRNVCLLSGAIPTTSDKTVELVHLDDYFSNDRRDWKNRQVSEFVKIQPPIPVEYKFMYSEDRRDTMNQDWRLQNIEPYASYTHTIENGFSDAVELESDFAPTFMDNAIGGLPMPAIRSENKYQENSYDVEPRILFWGGEVDGSWIFNTTRIATYGYCYFHDRGASKSFRFGYDVDVVAEYQKSVFSKWAKFVGRAATSQIIEMDVIMYNEDLRNLGGSVVLDVDGMEREFFIYSIKKKPLDSDIATVQFIEA